MEQQNPRAQLEDLHRELSQTPDLDERGRRLLADVREDIERLDAAAAGRASGTGATPTTTAAPATLSPEEHEEIQSRWRTAVVDFEGSHPQLARGLERMAVILSNFGL